MSGSRRPLVTARRCSAQLSWRLPPRSRRWRSVRPEDAGIGADPASARELGVGGEALDAGDLADQLGGGQHAAAALGQQLRRERRRPARRARARARRSTRVSSRMRRSSSRAIRTRAVCSARARRPPTRSCQRPVISARGGISSSGQRSCRCQRRSLISAVRCATRRSRWSTSSRTSSSGPASCATGSVSSPSRIAARAIATASIASDLPRSRAELARAGHQLRRHAHDPLAAREQEALQRARRRAGSPRSPTPARRRGRAPSRNRSSNERRLALDRPVGEHAAGRGVDRRDACASACACPPRSRSSAPSLRWDHLTNGSPADTSQSGRCHAPIRSRRRSSDGGGRHNIRRSDHWSTESQ